MDHTISQDQVAEFFKTELLVANQVSKVVEKKELFYNPQTLEYTILHKMGLKTLRSYKTLNINHAIELYNEI